MSQASLESCPRSGKNIQFFNYNINDGNDGDDDDDDDDDDMMI